MSSYDSICHNVNEALEKNSWRLTEAFDRETHSPSQVVCAVVLVAAKSTVGTFAGAPCAVDESLGVITIARCAAGTDASARWEASSSQTRSRDDYADAFSSLQGQKTFCRLFHRQI